MNPMTMRAVSLGVVVAVWTAISEMAKVNLSLWPVIVALGCSLAAGGGIPGLQRTLAATTSGVVWAPYARATSWDSPGRRSSPGSPALQRGQTARRTGDQAARQEWVLSRL